MNRPPHGTLRRQAHRDAARLLGALFLVLSVTACVTGNRDVNLKAVQSWHGVEEEELLATWGVPTSLDEYDNGYKVLHYNDYTPPQEKRPPGIILLDSILPEAIATPQHMRQTSPYVCLAQFVIAPDGTVERSAWYGDQCAPRPKRDG